MDALKAYTIKALVSTVDHLGSVSYKVNDILSEKIDEVSVTDIRVSQIEQVWYPKFLDRYLNFFDVNAIDMIDHWLDL